MANREALRELQSRLRAACKPPVRGVPASWLAVESAGAGYLFPLAQSGRDFSFASAQSVPYPQAWFSGRGQPAAEACTASSTWPVCGRPRTTAMRSDATRAESRLVAQRDDRSQLRPADRPSGRPAQPGRLRVLRRAPEGSPDYSAAATPMPTEAYWQEINLQALSQQSQFLSISLSHSPRRFATMSSLRNIQSVFPGSPPSRDGGIQAN